MNAYRRHAAMDKDKDKVPTIKGYTTVWSDDFSGPAGSLAGNSNWNVIVAPPNWGSNQECQTYTNSVNNVRLTGSGRLQITPLLMIAQNSSELLWTSGRLEGKASFACEAGKSMILQAKLRNGSAPFDQQSGIWPAFWALGESFRSGNPDVVGWPRCGEWDIMETTHGNDFTVATVHYSPKDGAHEYKVTGRANFSVRDFHTFAIRVDRTKARWQDEVLEWFVDGKVYCSIRGGEVGNPTVWDSVAHKAFFPVLNVAVGSIMDGSQPDGRTASGATSGMEVEYVAFYKSI